MKVDFHCHTRNYKTGDGEKRDVTDEQFIDKVTSAGVEIVAVTNHNGFDIDQYNRLDAASNGMYSIWPGVELDIAYGSDSNYYHLIVICNPKNVESFHSSLDTLTNGSTKDNFKGEIGAVVASFDSLDCIFMPHFHKKPAIPQEEFELLESLLSNKNRLIAESTNVRSMGIFVNHGINCIAGSDIKDWDLYPNMELPELRLEIENFEHLCKILDRDESFVKTLLDKNTSQQFEVYPKKNNRDIRETIRLYNEVNVIFGDKGTGKSEVIKSLIATFKARNIPYAEYISSETAEALEDMLETDDMLRAAESLGIDGCEKHFKMVEVWGDKAPTPLSEYKDYHHTYKAKASQKAVGWSRMGELADDEGQQIDKAKADLDSVASAIELLDEVKTIDYLGEEKASALNALLSELQKNVLQKHKKEVIEYESTLLTNFTIEKYKYYTSAKTGNGQKPSGVGFAKFANNRLKLKHALDSIVQNLLPNEKSTYEVLGHTGGKGRIEIESRYRMLNDIEGTKSIHQEFNNNITKLREVKESILKTSRSVLKYELDKPLVELKDRLADCSITSTGDFIGVYRQTVDKERQPYEPSNGERSIIFIQKALNNPNARVYLLDEPELSMANSYIDEIIRPKITGLGKQKKMVVLATHNANLAVRTLPYSTMYRYHGAEGYKTYVGNPFTNLLTNIDDENDTKDWKGVSMRILEGGEDAFYDRGGIYESGRG